MKRAVIVGFLVIGSIYLEPSRAALAADPPPAAAPFVPLTAPPVLSNTAQQEEGGKTQLRLQITPGGAVGLTGDSGHCIWLDARQTGWGATSVVMSFLTGTTGLGTLAIGDNQPEAKTFVGISTIVLGGFGALSAYLSTHYSSEYKAFGCVGATS